MDPYLISRGEEDNAIYLVKLYMYYDTFSDATASSVVWNFL